MGVLFVLVGRLKCCRYLGTSNEVVMFFFAVSIEGSQLLLYASAKKSFGFIPKKFAVSSLGCDKQSQTVVAVPLGCTYEARSEVPLGKV